MSFWSYALKRVAITILLLVGSSILLFALLRLLPGDPAQVILGLRYTPEAAAIIEERLGLDQPIPVQYVRWIGELAQGDLGQDFRNNRPIGLILAQRIPVTIQLAVMAIVIAIGIALVFGIGASLIKGRWAYGFSDFLSMVGMSLPDFWLGIMVILVFAEHLLWLPPSGYVAPSEDVLESLRRMVLPAVTLGIPLGAVLLRFVDQGLRNALTQDYVRTARARGVSELGVVGKHALRNASLPVVTVIGLQFGYLLGGAVIVEEVFSLPGVGRLILSAVTERNYIVAQQAILVVIALFLFVNLIVDLLYGVLDPRVKARAQ